MCEENTKQEYEDKIEQLIFRAEMFLNWSRNFFHFYEKVINKKTIEEKLQVTPV